MNILPSYVVDYGLESRVVFRRKMMKTELVAITFPNENGAEGLLKTLERLMQEDLIESKNAIIVSKDFQGNLRVQRSAPISKNSGK